ncbi:A24 family peptidase [uncultured Umboniibacter sp.]|uniref:prepilin peptidase n=1 Tax=uncultured Umboniibacter sp. TaxID=1798917 RepID=UPI0026275A29|nr:A24 family peptidase [uncultured Umboniibacter sp.]
MLALFQQNPGYLIAIATILGLVVGSFLNVVIHRLPKILQAQWAAEFSEEEAGSAGKQYNLAFPASHCPNCDAPIKPWQNLPLISWLMLKGRCASCRVNIHWRYPVVELATGILTGFAAWYMGAVAPVIYVIIAIWILIALIAIDIDCYLLPDTLTLPLLWAGLIANSLGWFTDLDSALWGAVAGYLSLWIIFWLFKLATGKEGMGYGDFKLLAALGAWMGWQALPMIILISSFVGALLGILAIVIYGRDKAKPIPFGPYLAIAGLLVFFFEDFIRQVIPLFAGL